MFNKVCTITALLFIVQLCTANILSKETQKEVTTAVEEIKKIAFELYQEKQNQFKLSVDQTYVLLNNSVIENEELIQTVTENMNKLTKNFSQEAQDKNVNIQKCLEIAKPLKEAGNDLRIIVKQCFINQENTALSIRAKVNSVMYKRVTDIDWLLVRIKNCKDDACLKKIIEEANDIKKYFKRDLDNMLIIPEKLIGDLTTRNGYCYLMEQVKFHTTNQIMAQNITRCANNIIDNKTTL